VAVVVIAGVIVLIPVIVEVVVEVVQCIQIMVRLDPTADMAHFSHRPTAEADYSRPIFLLLFNLLVPYFIEVS
jgi:hypothetical protein